MMVDDHSDDWTVFVDEVRVAGEPVSFSHWLVD